MNSGSQRHRDLIFEIYRGQETMPSWTWRDGDNFLKAKTRTG